MALQENSYQRPGVSNTDHDFNINLNKTFDLNQCGHLEASDEIKTTLEPFSKLIVDCENQKNGPKKSSEIESDESLGILPDLLTDEMTCDLLKAGLSFSDNDTHDVVDPEINENPTTSVFSPPSGNQFNKISLFLKNVSTPLANFENDRRCSSTPKVLATSQFPANATNIIGHNSSYFLDEKEDPIIAGSCRIKFETDFNLDDLKNMKPLTSTYKALSLPQVPLILNEQTDLKSKVYFQEKPETFKNNLNITQTFSNDSESLSPCKHENSVQNVNILNNTFKIRPSDFTETVGAVVSVKHSIPSSMKVSEETSKICSEKKEVKILDCTFAIKEIKDNVDQEKTFVIDSSLIVEAEESPNPIYKKEIFNETHVLEKDSVDQVANLTFTKKLDEVQINLENHCYDSLSTKFEPMLQILEESCSENDLNVTKVHIKNLTTSEQFKTNVTFYDKLPENFSKEIIQEDLFEFVSTTSPKVLSSNFHEETGKNIGSFEQINFKGNEKNLSNKMSISDSINSIGDSFSGNIYKGTNQEINFNKDSIKRDNSLIELVLPKALDNATFNEEMREINYFNQINLTENMPTNKMLPSDPVQLISNSLFSEKTNESSAQKMDKISRRYSMPNENTGELEPFMIPIERKCVTFHQSEESNLESSMFRNFHNPIEKSILQPILQRTTYSLNLNLNSSSDANEDNVFTVNNSTSEEIEIFTHSSPIENCSLETVSKSTSTNNLSIEKTNQLQSPTNSVSTDNDQLSQNSLKDLSNSTFSENTGEIHIEPHSIPAEINKFQLSPSGIKNISFSNSLTMGTKIQHEIRLSQCKKDSAGETTSSNFTNFCIKETLPKKVADNCNSPKKCSLESKIAAKGRLSKPTRIVFPRVVSDKHVGKSLCKPSVNKRPIVSDLNRTLNVNNSLDKTSPKEFHRKLSLPSPSLNNDKKCENNFKKPFKIPSILVGKRSVSNYQNSKLDIKYSSGHLKNITTVNHNLNLPSPDLISDTNSKMIKFATSVCGKGQRVSSRLSYEKLPMKSFKTKEFGLKTNAAIKNSLEKKTNITSSPKVIDLSRKVKLTENSNNTVKNSSKHSIVLNSPKKCANSLINIPNKTCDSKLVVITQKSVPAGNSYKPQHIKSSNKEKLSNYTANPKFSLLPKFHVPVKSESKSLVDKALSSGNRKSNGFPLKAYIPKAEAVQFVKTQISTGQKLKDNTRENTQLDSSICPTSNVKKSIGRFSFLPMPKDVKNVKLNGICTAPKSDLQNRVCRQAPGKLPQLRRIPSPLYHK